MAALTGTLSLIRATVDWRDERARCVGLFRSTDAAAMEVEYSVALDDDLLDLLARAFLQAGVPVLRASKVETPHVTLMGDTLQEYGPARAVVQRFGVDGQPKVDKRTRAYKQQQAAAVGGSNGDGQPNGNGAPG